MVVMLIKLYVIMHPLYICRTSAQGAHCISQLMKLIDKVWHKWELFGIALDIPPKVLGQIKSDFQMNAMSCRDNLLKVVTYLEDVPKQQCTWGMIHASLKTLGRNDIAGHFSDTYHLDKFQLHIIYHA